MESRQTKELGKCSQAETIKVEKTLNVPSFRAALKAVNMHILQVPNNTRTHERKARYGLAFARRTDARSRTRRHEWRGGQRSGSRIPAAVKSASIWLLL